MKVAARIFIIIGLIEGIAFLLCSLFFRGTEFSGFYLIYGIYAFAMSFGSLVSVNHSAKVVIAIWGVLYLPVMFLASIFMFCIKKEDCF